MTAQFDYELLTRLRKGKQWSRTQLAARIGVTEAAIRKWESGAVTPGLVVGVRLAKALEVRAEQLVTDAA
jgi:transcriptional regulator with XRE-family HTH domain